MKKNLGMRGADYGVLVHYLVYYQYSGTAYSGHYPQFQSERSCDGGVYPDFLLSGLRIMSIPAGLLIDRFGEKPVLFGGFLMPFIGTILFACMHTYPMLLASSFIIGLGMAMLQTVLNPLQRTVGGEENYAFIAELAQFMFGIASFLSPLVYTYLIRELDL